MLNNQWVKEEIKREIKKYLEVSGNTTHWNLRDALKVTLRGEFKKSILTPQGIRKKKKTKWSPQLEGRKWDKLEGRKERNGRETKKTTKKISEIKLVFWKEKIDKALATLTKKKKTQINQKWHQIGTTDTTEIQGIMKDCYE